jgi:putative protease
MAEVDIGTISDFFARLSVAAVTLSAPLKVGDMIHIKGHTTDIIMTVDSMQIDNANVTEAKTGDGIGIKIPDRARKGDSVFLVTA